MFISWSKMNATVPGQHLHSGPPHAGDGGWGVPLGKNADSMRNMNTNWKTCEIQVQKFWECSTSVFILLFYSRVVFF